MTTSTDTQTAAEPAVEMCKCGRAMYRHGRKSSAGRKFSCGDLKATETRETFTRRYERTPVWRRWLLLLHTPEGW